MRRKARGIVFGSGFRGLQHTHVVLRHELNITDPNGVILLGTDISNTQPNLSLNPVHVQLDLNLSLLFGYNISLPSPFFKAIGRSKSVFHELHVCHLSVIIDLAPDRKGADGHLSQGSRTIGEAAKDRYVFSSAGDGLDIKSLIGPDSVDGSKGINDGLRVG